MHQKQKPKNPWLIFIWLIWSLIAPGCAQFPGYSYQDCKADYADTPDMIEACKKEVNQREAVRRRNEERATEKAACQWPHGIWVSPPGYCRSLATYL